MKEENQTLKYSTKYLILLDVQLIHPIILNPYHSTVLESQCLNSFHAIINKYKVRLVTKGFNQLLIFGFVETSTPVIKPVTIKFTLTLALTNHWALLQFDIKNAFWKGPSICSNIQHFEALYGLKQGPR